jgi:hypothetical protein
MRLNDGEVITSTDNQGRSQMTEELIALLRNRIEARYYEQPQVIEVIARAILHSRGLYP